MRRTIIVIMMFYAMLNCIANVSVTQSMYLPPQNVVAEFMEVEDLSEGSRGESLFWNFSTATITDGNAHRRYIHPLDSLYIEQLDGSMHKYLLSGDTLYWKGFENPGTDMRDSITAVVMRFPFSYGDSLFDSYILKGKYYRQLYFVESGNIEVVADALGTIKMPEGDTISNIIRVKETKRFHAYMSPQSINVPLDTIADTIPLQVQTRYRWYAHGHTLPIAEIIEKKVFKNHQLEAEERKCFIVDIDSRQLQTLRNAQQRSINLKSLNGTTTSIQGEQITPHDNIQAITATESSRGVSLRFNVVHQATMLSIDVVDFGGRVYYSSESQNYPKGEYQRELPLAEIPNGDYMIVIITDGDKDNPIKQLVKRR